MINLVPGIDIDLGGVANQSVATTAPPKPITALAALTQSQTSNIPPGGLNKQVTSVMNANKSSSIGDVHLHNYGQVPNGQQIAAEMAFMTG